MDLLQLQYFRAIAEYENMTKAAQALFVSQPNLSISMSRLESNLGTKLFDRRRGKLSLTAEGRTFLEHVRAALDEIDAGVRSLQEAEEVRPNSIRIASSMPDLMARILTRAYSDDPAHPLRIKQVNCPNRLVPELVASEEVDFGLCFGEVTDSLLEHRVLLDAERVVLLRRDHPLAGERYIPLSRLAGEKFILNHYRDDGLFLGRVPALAGFTPNVCFECDSLQMERALLVARNAVSIGPAASFQRILADEPDCPVTCLRFSPPVPGIVMNVVRRRGHLLSPAALEFLAHLNRHFEDENRNTDALMRAYFP